jgi:putative colanic acid biosynthesis acetyltransferase WcaF
VNVDLSLTSRRDYHPGRSFATRAAWLVAEAILFSNPLVISYRFKRLLLRMFGCRVGNGVIIKPGAKVKYPWRLSIGDHAWIGERAWIDNMEDVEIGASAVISQGAYVCTGNHDWSDPGMGLTPTPSVIEDGAWVAAFARVGPGVRIAKESIVGFGAVALESTEPSGIYVGNPATRVGWRTVRDAPGPALVESLRVSR